MPGTAPQLPATDSLPGRTIGGYVVKQRLSEGGMGMVYLAEHQAMGRRAAVKFLKPEVANSAEWTTRFLTEARALAALKHRNLVDVFEFGATPDGFQYLMMEFIEGTSLEAYLIEQAAIGRLPLVPAQALKFAEQILNGLGEAHKKGIVHRDLKPANIMKVREHSGDVLLKIVDFGLARQDPVDMVHDASPRLNQASLLAGTPEYIAPEQARGLRGDGRADLYALGVMLYEMLSGHLPFKSESVLDLMKMQAFEPPPPLAQAASGLPEGVSEFVHQLLEKEPDLRPASADVARQAVHRLLKALERDATSVKASPSRHAETAKIERVVSSPTTENVIAIPARADRRRKAALVIGLLGLLLAWFLWPSGPSPVVSVAPPFVAPPPVVVAPIVEQPAAAPIVPSRPAVSAADSELAPLKRPRPAPSITIEAPRCSPDEEWKKSAKATLNELAARASKMKSAEFVLWADDRERALSSAIASATSKNECGAVDTQLAEFRERVRTQ